MCGKFKPWKTLTRREKIEIVLLWIAAFVCMGIQILVIIFIGVEGYKEQEQKEDIPCVCECCENIAERG